jgi:UDP-N-acetylglucosamine acyltransferase
MKGKNMPEIHATAIVDPKAQIADNVEIGPYCIVGPDVKIGSGTKLIAQCHITGQTTLGENNTVYPFAALGTQAEDYDFKGGNTYLRIGDNNIFREGVTVNSGTKDGSETVIGNGCFLMANVHVAHNCILGNKVIMVVNAGISGYVQVGDNALLSGLTGIHQFCRIGRFCVLSGGSIVSLDVPPFMIADGRNGALRGINIVGLKRNNFSPDTIRAIKNIYKIFCRSGLNTKNALEKIRADLPAIPEVEEFIQFVESSERGVLKSNSPGRRA